jgi:hypothetical protein
VVVEAGVVAEDPADEVELDVGVAVDELVDALVCVVSYEGLPSVGSARPAFQVSARPGDPRAATSLTAGTQA